MMLTLAEAHTMLIEAQASSQHRSRSNTQKDRGGSPRLPTGLLKEVAIAINTNSDTQIGLPLRTHAEGTPATTGSWDVVPPIPTIGHGLQPTTDF